MQQVIEDLLERGVPGKEILFVRFDLEILREVPGGLRSLLHWFADEVRGRGLRSNPAAFVLLDEIHKLPRWSEQVKHAFDTFLLKLLITGSSSVLVARGGRESLAGRIFTTEVPTFSFREVVEAWHPQMADALPDPIHLVDCFEPECRETFDAIHSLRGQQKLALKRILERYFSRGGYPRLHSGEVEDDRWADYLTQTVFENVLGADIPDLFPVQDPGLLRHLYLSVARLTGSEISQPSLVDSANVAGFRTTQPTVGRYLHYLADALLIREFRRYPLHRQRSARVPAKITLADLGVRNAIFRGAPSLWESDPGVVGPLTETLVQTVLRGVNLQVHFWKDYELKGKRQTPRREVDFVVEATDGRTLPVEVKFKQRIDGEDRNALRVFRSQHGAIQGILVTRDSYEWDGEAGIISIPLLEFLLAF